MKLIHYIYITLALMLLSACQADEIVRYVYTVGEADNAIKLRAGISDGEAGVVTRANGDVVYHKFEGATQLRLRVEGTWLGKENYTLPHGSVTNTLAKQITKATTAQDATVDSDQDTQNILDTHTVSFEDGDHLSWDDYGSADPANMPTGKGGVVTDGTDGRSKGLTIYGVAVNGQSLPDVLSEGVSWTDLEWQVGTPSASVIDQKDGWLAKDLLTSNNVTESNNNTYKFDARNAGKLLEFRHAMTKVTVNLIADAGFPGYTTDHPENAKFTEKPAVTLLGFNYIGKVSVEGWESTPTQGTANFEAWRDNGSEWKTDGQHISQFTALVFPGNQFADDKDILKLEVDGNTLYVKAKKINEANTEEHNTFEHGKNYIFNIKVQKTGIIVTATIKNWEDVVATEEAPKINITKVYGHPTQDGHPAFTESFDLYRSTDINGSYLGTGDHAVVSYNNSEYAMTPQLYWPTHETHYFFRGVWPKVNSTDGPTSTDVHDNTIDVNNVKYEKNKYPSDLMIGRPLLPDDKTPDETCKVHTSPETQGICATEGRVHINFRYVMSQVEVELKTVSGDAAVNIDKNTKVELVNVVNSGVASLSEVSVTPATTKENYTLNNVEGNGNELKRHSAIVPQALTYSTVEAEKANNLRFKITATNTDGSTDVYYADVEPILKSDKSGKIAPTGKWESGVHYKYVLTLSKTAIKVTATLTDWVEVEADDNVWF